MARKKARPLVDDKDLKSFIHYCPETGEFTWARDWYAKKAGDSAGCVKNSASGKYLVIRILGNLYYGHRLAWFYVHGEWPNVIDHIDGDGLNNRLENLRNVDHKDNSRNMARPVTNKSGVIGVHHSRWYGTWVAQGKVMGKARQLYQGPSKRHAVFMRKLYEVASGYHKNHGKRISDAAKSMQAAAE